MSLAIGEKKPQQQRRPSGFVAIFFQLLDWNRRLAKKKFFSRKPLPSVRAAKGPAKKYGADDKMPLAKLLLIDDENQGGFPGEKNSETDVDLGNGMRAPGLVARLMGLQAMPVVAYERPRKATDSGHLSNEQGSGRESLRMDQDLCLEDGGIGKLETRPHKLQKTGAFLERKRTDHGRAKPGASGKKVLSSPSKEKLRKLVSPVKSPRLPSVDHRTRLMKAATKILEPGLQSRSRAKSALTYMDSFPGDAKGADFVTILKESKEPICDPLLPDSSMSYGSLGGTSRSEPGEEESLRPKIGSSSSKMSHASCSHAGFVEDRLIPFDMEGEHSRTQKTSASVQAKITVQGKVKGLGERYNQNSSKTKPDGSPTVFPRNQFTQNQSTRVKNKAAIGSSISSRKQGERDAYGLNGTKGSVFIDRNVGNCSRLKTAYEKSSHRRALGSNSLEKNMPRKRTISSFSVKNVDAFHSSRAKQSVKSDMSNKKGTRHNSNRSVYKKCIENESKNDHGDDLIFRRNDIVSFTFNSQIRRASMTSVSEGATERSRTKKEHINEIGCDRNLMSLAKGSNLTSNRRAILRGDELSNLLEQKIRELTSMNREKLEARDAWSASSIFEELGTAFISEPNYHKHTNGSSQKGVVSCSVDHSVFPIQQSQEAKFGPAATVHSTESNQLSPVSILEASFSNESCSFGSLDASSGGKLQFGLAENCNATRSSDLDTELLDSATSVDIRRSIIHKIRHLTYTSLSDPDIHCDDIGFSKTKLGEARHAILNAVLLFENFTLYRSDNSVDTSLESFLLDMLQAILDALRVELIGEPSYTGTKGTDQLRELIFDCMIECLNSRYYYLCNSGYTPCCNLPFLTTQEQLMREVAKEIRGWIDLAGKYLDDLVKNETETSFGKWTYCKIEAFEASTEMESNILENLVDELVIDFWRC
ncbi:hypothetical protein OPV22_019854 [Ensete ventricosum]|uniref:DUF3741 domain-containing protein n=1 Tax=Ensete ventricosum TaxID=4639 RepID=A0AAV8QD61_ENSVE|nr:hypothetical protein OPV22_019854 [Ensete ventricosum]